MYRFPSSGRGRYRFALDSSLAAGTAAWARTAAAAPLAERLLSMGSGRRQGHGSNSDSESPGPSLLNLALVGPPGSGKGSYGRHFASDLGIPLVTASDLLRRLRPEVAGLLSEGKLVDDAVVAGAVLEGLTELRDQSKGKRRNGNGSGAFGYVLDGFPRTLRQVELMEATWPGSLGVATVVHLDVPDFVCEAKLLGRRSCSGCGRSWNASGVDKDPWFLPAFLPGGNGAAEACGGKTGGEPCDASLRRDDDAPGIVGDRLRAYHRNADPILDFFRGSGGGHRLLTLRPYRGFEDLPGLTERLRSHVGAG